MKRNKFRQQIEKKVERRISRKQKKEESFVWEESAVICYIKKLILNDRIERIICTILSNNKFGIKTLLRFEIEISKISRNSSLLEQQR